MKDFGRLCFKIGAMNQTEGLSFQSLIEALKAGMTLRFADLNALVIYRNGLYRVSFPNCTQRLCEDDFLALYGSYPAVIYKSHGHAGLDEKRDEEYYAWRREKQ